MGRTIPKYMQCDACSAVAWHVDSRLVRLQQGLGTRKMKGYEVLEAMESVCAAEEGELLDAEGKPYDWGEYSVKTDPADKTRKVLAGPGCEQSDQNGFGQYGGFRSRLMVKCEEVIGREAEEDIYAAFQITQDDEQEGAESAFGPLQSFLCQEDCDGAAVAGGRGGGGTAKKSKKKKSKKGKKGKKANKKSSSKD